MNKNLAKVGAKAERDLMRQGVVHRAQTFTNRKREASRKACRGKVAWS